MTASRTPAVSVLIPLYNAEPFIGATIESVLAQTFADFELVILNDGSTDASGKIAEEYAAGDERVRVFHQENKGLTATRNSAVAFARGELLAWQDNDDTSYPARLEKQVAYMHANPDCAYLGAAAEIFSEGEDAAVTVALVWHEQLCDRLLTENCFFSGSVMLRKSALLACNGYDERPGTNVVEDFDMAMRIAQRHRVANLPEVLYRYRLNPGGLSISNRELQVSNLKELTRRMRERRSYRSFWLVPGYSIRKTLFIPAGLPKPHENAYRRTVLRTNRNAIRLLLRQGEVAAALKRIMWRMRYPFGRVTPLA